MQLSSQNFVDFCLQTTPTVSEVLRGRSSYRYLPPRPIHWMKRCLCVCVCVCVCCGRDKKRDLALVDGVTDDCVAFTAHTDASLLPQISCCGLDITASANSCFSQSSACRFAETIARTFSYLLECISPSVILSDIFISMPSSVAR